MLKLYHPSPQQHQTAQQRKCQPKGRPAHAVGTERLLLLLPSPQEVMSEALELLLQSTTHPDLPTPHTQAKAKANLSTAGMPGFDIQSYCTVSEQRTHVSRMFYTKWQLANFCLQREMALRISSNMLTHWTTLYCVYNTRRHCMGLDCYTP